jgi:tRNA(Ile)-lysidine synthase
MQTLLKQVEGFIEREKLFNRSDRLVVGVSGGLDSVVLVHVLQRLQYELELAHMNYGLRGAESERDEQFVRQLAEQWGLTLQVKKIDPAVFSREGNLQETARKLRYDWLEELVYTEKLLRQGQPSSYMLTAHHANDQAETILMNLFRGSGLNGIKGMQPKRGKLCRPLLFAERASLEAYAAAEGLKWVEDSSNLTDKYSRNRIRQQVLPAITALYPDSIRRIYLNSRNFQSLAVYTEQQVQRSLSKLIEQKGAEQWLPILKWKQTVGGDYLLFEWLQRAGFSAEQVEQAVTLMESQTGQYIQNGEYQLLKNRNWLILSKKEPALNEWVVIENPSGEIEFAGGRLSWSSLSGEEFTIPTDASIAVLDSSLLAFPMLLRRWKAGDYFYPLGLAKKKKIARFLTDEKLSRNQKENTWVLEADKKICWVVGLRLDDRFKVKPSTKEILRFQLHLPVSSGI